MLENIHQYFCNISHAGFPYRPGPPDLKALNAKRQNKIERFKQQKETEKHLQELKPLVEREHVDDEVKVKKLNEKIYQ